ncbi:MAG: 3-phosphoshikimate 1-carboxyvinyltransferase [Hyphomicrobiales bacterium]
MTGSKTKPLRSRRKGKLSGHITVPGDKSISHRSLMLGAIAAGDTVIEGLLESEDVHATARAMAAFGARIERHRNGRWTVAGLGEKGLQQPSLAIDFGNAGTGVRLAIGLMSTTAIRAEFTGDASLTKRPMGRIIQPLEKMGTRFDASEGNRLPAIVRGAVHPSAITYELPVASAQIKSAILLAALNTPGATTVVEPVPTRDHTERMLRAFGGAPEISTGEDGARFITINGPVKLEGQNVAVPADPSSAAFPIVAALITDGSEITLPGVMMNDTRSGLIGVLREMGADISIENERPAGGETVADLTVHSSELHGIKVSPDVAPSMIDEYPVLAVAAACANGVTEMHGLEELRVKESDRLSAIAEGLAANGVKVETGDDWLKVYGTGSAPDGGGTVATHLDHRIAMAFLVLGLATESPVTVDDGDTIATSFPDFVGLMERAGAAIEEVEPAA